MLNLCGSVAAILKMATVEIVQWWESIRDIISTHISNVDDIGQCLIFAAILKMATARNLSMSGNKFGIS